MRVKKLVAGAGAALLLALALVGGLAGRAEASGVTTHSWMATEAIRRVSDPALRALLEANVRQVEGGAHFPDSGFGSSALPDPIPNTYGEEAHWPRFSYAYLDQIRDDPDCGDLTEPNGPCAARIAHAFGAVAHGIGDEVWDWLFEPNAPDQGESYAPPNTPANTAGMELQMDMIAIQDHRRPTRPDLPLWPDHPALLDVFADIGRTDIVAENLSDGERLIRIVRAAERLVTTNNHHAVTANQPWLAAHLVTAPGGIRFAARAIAANWDTLWGRLLGDQPATRVAITYPADGDEEIPATGWTRSTFLPGSSPDRGGAATRITAVLSSSLAYRPTVDSPNTISDQLPPGAMTLTEAGTGAPVPIRAGYPKVVPYNPETGEHTIDIQPDGDLAPCTEYRVKVTDHLLDAEGEPVRPHTWTFRTDGCTEPVRRPDAWVRVVDEFRANDVGAWFGADVQNVTGAGQQRATTAPRGRAMGFDVNLVNDGNVADRFGVRGQPRIPGFAVRYLDDAGNDVSRAVKTGTYRTPVLAPGESIQLHLVITVKPDAATGASVTRTVRITSRSDPGMVDAVKVTLTEGPQPTLGPVVRSASAEREVAALSPGLFCYLE